MLLVVRTEWDVQPRFHVQTDTAAGSPLLASPFKHPNPPAPLFFWGLYDEYRLRELKCAAYNDAWLSKHGALARLWFPYLPRCPIPPVEPGITAKMGPWYVFNTVYLLSPGTIC